MILPRSLNRTLNNFWTLKNYANIEKPAIVRRLSMHNISDNFYLCTDKPRDIAVDKKSMRFTQTKQNSKPLVLMISWIYGKKRQINKYCKLYTDQGFDVLVARLSLTQLVFSVSGFEDFGQKIIDALNNNEDHYKEIFMHSFSAGGGVFGVAQRMIEKDMERYGSIPDRIIGQVWDSIAHPVKSVDVVPMVLFPNNIMMQKIVRSATLLYLNSRKKLQWHIDDAVSNLFSSRVRSPALIFSSKTDPIGTAEFSQAIVKSWRENGVDVTYKNFDDSPHVKHMQIFPAEYLRLLHKHWSRVKLLERN